MAHIVFNLFIEIHVYVMTTYIMSLLRW